MIAAAPRSPVLVVFRGALLVALLAAVGVFHVWSHARVTGAGYRLEELRVRQKDLAAEQARLELEVAALRAPGRLEQYARARLGMAPPAPGSVVAWGAGEAAAGRAGKVGGEESHRPAPVEPVKEELAAGGSRLQTPGSSKDVAIANASAEASSL